MDVQSSTELSLRKVSKISRVSTWLDHPKTIKIWGAKKQIKETTKQLENMRVGCCGWGVAGGVLRVGEEHKWRLPWQPPHWQTFPWPVHTKPPDGWESSVASWKSMCLVKVKCVDLLTNYLLTFFFSKSICLTFCHLLQLLTTLIKWMTWGGVTVYVHLGTTANHDHN